MCNSNQDAKEQFAAAMVVEHTKKNARRDEDHREWVDEHTENGTLAVIRDAL